MEKKKEIHQKQHKIITELIRKYGISQSVIHKWCNLYGEIKADTGEIATNAEIFIATEKANYITTNNFKWLLAYPNN
ncbi:MAG: hypothetical protein IKG14_01810 [Clostridia bacterium]|nr:hypothetical protein [Clostridia bacterium]